ncbi:MAG: hypothetical protein KAS32_17590 [Candidatus Peribacteraceae bacterium]|nr:hypothetical protein [Candidatus Peribacteraceae bacterium]
MSEKSRNRQASKERCPQDIEYSICYPEENPDTAINDITRVLSHVGLFDEMQ